MPHRHRYVHLTVICISSLVSSIILILFLLFPRKNYFSKKHIIDHFTVVCLVVWPLNESEAGVDLVLIETSLHFLC